MDKYNRLTIIKEVKTQVSPSGHKTRMFLCECECGKKIITSMQHLKSGHTKSCGCYAKEVSVKNGKIIKHGLTYKNGKITRLYRTWSQMKTRCLNKNSDHYKDYGGRGIKVCDEWMQFEPFYEWSIANGYSDTLTIDRIDVNGNYEPSNCRWASIKEQSNNKRNTPIVEYDGEIHTLKEWSEITGIYYQTLFYRYHAGKTPSEILKYRKEKK